MWSWMTEWLCSWFGEKGREGDIAEHGGGGMHRGGGGGGE